MQQQLSSSSTVFRTLISRFTVPLMSAIVSNALPIVGLPPISVQELGRGRGRSRSRGRRKCPYELNSRSHDVSSRFQTIVRIPHGRLQDYPLSSLRCSTSHVTVRCYLLGSTAGVYTQCTVISSVDGFSDKHALSTPFIGLILLPLAVRGTY